MFSNNLLTGTHPYTTLKVAQKIAHLGPLQRNPMHAGIERKLSTRKSIHLSAYLLRAVVRRPVCTLKSPGKHFQNTNAQVPAQIH